MDAPDTRIYQGLGPTTASLVRAAEARGIPWIRLNSRTLVQLGYGKHQRRIQAGITSETGCIAMEIASDKRLTRRLLEGLGLPVFRREAVAGAPRSAGCLYRILVVGGRAVAVAQRLAGKAIDRTDAIHEDNRLVAEQAVQAIGLDVAGVDFVSPDIARSYREAGGGITSVEPAPDLRIHLAPAEGTPRDVAGQIIEMLFPQGAPCRIPLAAITGTNGKTTTARMVAGILKLAGLRVGLATADGIYVDGDLTVPGDMTGPSASQLILRDPRVDVAVLETPREGIERSGLGWSECNVGAILNVANIAGDPRGLDDLARVKQVVVEVAQDFCVLNADDPCVAAMARHSRAEPIYVTTNVKNRLVRRHIRERKRAVVLEEGLNGPMLVLYQHEEQHLLLYAHQIPASRDGLPLHNIHNAMFAAAIASGLGASVAHIVEGLRTFAADFAPSPQPAPLREEVLEETASESYLAARAG